MRNRALLVVDMQNGFELSIEVLSSYELAGIASISEGHDVGLDRTPLSA